MKTRRNGGNGVNGGNNSKAPDEYPNYYKNTNLSNNEQKSLLRQYETSCENDLLPKYNALIAVQEKNEDLKPSVVAGWKNTRANVKKECARVNAYSKWLASGSNGNAPALPDYTYLMSAEKWPADFEKNYRNFRSEVNAEKMNSAVENARMNATNSGKCCACPATEATLAPNNRNRGNGGSKAPLPSQNALENAGPVINNGNAEALPEPLLSPNNRNRGNGGRGAPQNTPEVENLGEPEVEATLVNNGNRANRNGNAARVNAETPLVNNGNRSNRNGNAARVNAATEEPAVEPTEEAARRRRRRQRRNKTRRNRRSSRRSSRRAARR